VDPLQFLLLLVVLAAVVLVVSAPLRRAGGSDPEGQEGSDLEGSGPPGLTPEGLTPEVAETPALLAARDAKYQEIRDAELDRRTGKLSDEDWAAMDAQLRAEAVEILRRLDQARDD
jgi:hypothetical protein